MEDVENLFHPSLSAALMKLDPEDGAQILEYFKTHALLSREKVLLQASVREQKKLLVENTKLKKEIEALRLQLQEQQRRRSQSAARKPATDRTASTQAPPPGRVSPAPSSAVTQPPPVAGATASSSQERKERPGRRRRGGRKARPASDPPSLEAEPGDDVSRLDLRVGRILSARRHPLADALSVQEVDVGEEAPRTVVSKLGARTDLEELRGSLGVLLCNMRACKLRGVVSQARLLCCPAPSDDTAELLAPPPGSAPGDRVTFLNYPGDPDRELPPRQGVWERVQGELQVDARGVASYRGCGFQVKGKGLCRAPSLTGCSIR